MHRALERAFTRPLGALPWLPPYLSAKVWIKLFIHVPKMSIKSQNGLNLIIWL